MAVPAIAAPMIAIPMNLCRRFAFTVLIVEFKLIETLCELWSEFVWLYSVQSHKRRKPSHFFALSEKGSLWF